MLSHLLRLRWRFGKVVDIGGTEHDSLRSSGHMGRGGLKAALREC